MWSTYFPALDAVVFVVDASDLERIGEARDELTKLLQNDEVAHAPVLVLGNKIDKQNALTEDHLKHYLGISQVIAPAFFLFPDHISHVSGVHWERSNLQGGTVGATHRGVHEFCGATSGVWRWVPVAGVLSGLSVFSV
jgi:GTPase SAR1 family protein